MIPTCDTNPNPKVTPSVILSGWSSNPDPQLATYAPDFMPPPVTRFGHLLVATWRTLSVDRSDQLTTTAPTSTCASFKPHLPTDVQRTSHRMTPEIDAPIQYIWDQDFGSLHLLAPMDSGADRSTISSLVLPSVDQLATQTFNEGRKVTLLQSVPNCN